ncbi:MAG: DUF1385 domain-containing protein [Gordonibacter urolithinfaciens]
MAPAFVTNLIVGSTTRTPCSGTSWTAPCVAVFVFYLWPSGRWPRSAHVRYHGAEHKTIHRYEHGLPSISRTRAASAPARALRTAFLIMVMIIAILVHGHAHQRAHRGLGRARRRAEAALVILVRILLMPVIAGISYEITVRWAGSHPRTRW